MVTPTPITPTATVAPQPLIGVGEVRHTRLRPVHRQFAYPSFFLLLPMRRLATPAGQAASAVPRNRWGPISFHDRDHGDGGPDALAWLDALLRREGVTEADGEVWLHCMPRVLGFAFKPVSFWYAHRADGRVAAIVAEVNNTFGERHCYLLSGPELAWGRELVARKVFHVSPFCRVAGEYRFRFLRTDLNAPSHTEHPRGRTLCRVDLHDEHGLLLQTSVSGWLQPATASALRRTFWRMPAMTLGVVWRIHWQALRLWLKRVPFIPKPAPPATPVSRGSG